VGLDHDPNGPGTSQRVAEQSPGIGGQAQCASKPAAGKLDLGHLEHGGRLPLLVAAALSPQQPLACGSQFPREGVLLPRLRLIRQGGVAVVLVLGGPTLVLVGDLHRNLLLALLLPKAAPIVDRVLDDVVARVRVDVELRVCGVDFVRRSGLNQGVARKSRPRLEDLVVWDAILPDILEHLALCLLLGRELAAIGFRRRLGLFFCRGSADFGPRGLLATGGRGLGLGRPLGV